MANLARALDLKRILTNISLGSNQTMDCYLRLTKAIVDALDAIQFPISNFELIQLTIIGLPEDYHSIRLLSPFPCSLVLLLSMTYDLNCSYISNTLIIRKIVIWLFIKLLSPSLGMFKVKGMLGGIIIRETATVIIRGLWSKQ